MTVPRPTRRTARWVSRAAVALTSTWLTAGASSADAVSPQERGASCGVFARPEVPPTPEGPFQVGTTSVVLTTQSMDRAGLMFPDGNIGVLRLPGAARYSIWGASGSFGGVGRWAGLPNGTYKFEGTLESIAAAREGGRTAAALMQGSSEPSPDGSDFDRDYAGGGPTYVISLNGPTASSHSSAAARTTPILLQIYHGEFNAIPGRGQLAYGGSGLAISRDEGRTFRKIGQILAPHVGRDEFFGARTRGGLWADASMIEADARGHRVSAPNASSQERERFDYLIFTDHNQVDEACGGLSLARVRTGELLVGVTEERAPHFLKFYQHGPAGSWQAGDFSEPGIGGRSTLVVGVSREFVNSPSIGYDSWLGLYVLAYQVNQKQVRISTSSDLLHWSAPQMIAAAEQDSPTRLFYPSVVGSGEDPADLGRSFFVFFLMRERDTQGRFSNPRLLRVRLDAPAH